MADYTTDSWVFGAALGLVCSAIMNDPARKLAHYQDVLDAPEHLIAELIHGTLITSPRPAPKHALAASVLGITVGGPFQLGRGGPGGWWIFDEPELHLDGNVVVPDLAGWRRERMPGLPSTAYFELAPDWICEVLSPSTEAHDRTDKLAIYGAARVEWAWLLNPILRTLEVLRNVDHKWVLQSSFRDDARVRAQPFDAIELSLADLWLPSQAE